MIFILSSITFAQQQSLAFYHRGYVENRVWLFPHHLDIPSYKNSMRWRPNLILELEDSSTYEFTITPNIIFHHGRDLIADTRTILEPTILEQIPPDFNGNKPLFDDVLLECDWVLDGENDISNIGDVLTFPRLFVDINTQRWDIRIGKQSLNWGSSLFFNPTDIVFQYLFAQPWQERKGLEGIRLQTGDQNWLLTTMVAIDLPYGLEDLNTISDINSSSQKQIPWYTGIRGTYNSKKQKNSVIAGLTDDFVLIGLDIKGDFTSRQIGYWFEGSIKNPHSSVLSEQKSFLQYSIGLDDSFDIFDGLRIALQISHDGSGEEPLFYEWSSREFLTFDANISDCDQYHIKVPQKNGSKRFLLGRWYGLGLLEMRIHDSWRIQTSFFSNLVDRSSVAFPAIIYEQNQYLVFMGVQSRFGSEGEFNPPFSQRNIMGVDLEVLYPSTQFLMWIRWSY